MTQPEVACLNKRVCLLHKQIQYVFCSFWIYNFFDLLVGLARFMKVSNSVSILTFKHGISHLWKLDRFFFFVQAPCNQNKVFNKQGVLTLEMGWPTKWPGCTYRQNKKNKDANKTRSNCAIIGWNLSKKHKLTLYKAQNGESNYVDYNFFFNFYQERQTSKRAS